jgi:SAM-dependent methyltransferase/tetratricopeptide (TPR) repeat protein
MKGPTAAELPLTPALKAIEAGRIDGALLLLKAAAQADPDNPETYYLAGLCLLRLADYDAALVAFQRAIGIEDDWPDPYLGGAQAQLARGDAHASMQTLLHVLGFSPQHQDATRHLVDLLAQLTPDSYLPALEPALRECFAHPEIDPSPLSRLCAQQLRLSIADHWIAGDEALTEATIASLVEGELWGLYLSRVINTDPILEELFTALRRRFCLNTGLEIGAATPVALIAALAQQCFLNEYVFTLSAEESAQCEAVDRVLVDPHAEADSVALAFSLRSMYRAPNLDSISRALAESLTPDYPWIEGLCRIAVFQPFEEAQLAETLPTMHGVHNEGSIAVQAQYEDNPYPRWQVPPDPPKSALANDFRRIFSRRKDSQREADGTRLLVAGCGTGFEPIDIARRDSSIAVTAIDLSRRSLAYAKRQAQDIGCTNVDFYQGDILDLPQTQWKFDLIVCTGVLHHMIEPLAGWSVLREKLADNGMMRISLYSVRARRLVSIAREQIKSRGLEGRPEDIREFRQWLLNEARTEEFASLSTSDDFYSMSGCRDLLFHVQEQHFTLPEIQVALEKLNLSFCGFDFRDGTILKAFSAQNPAPDAALDLAAWDQFEQENPDIFSTMYQFWCENE